MICSFPLSFPTISFSAARSGSGSEENPFCFAVCKVQFHGFMSALIDVNSVIISCYSANPNKFMRKYAYAILNFSMVVCFEVTLAM